MSKKVAVKGEGRRGGHLTVIPLTETVSRLGFNCGSFNVVQGFG